MLFHSFGVTMPDFTGLVAVKATKKEYHVLRHPTTGAPLDDHGEALWPNDSNTERMRLDGAIKVVEPESLRAYASQADEPASDGDAHVRAKKG
jgi:hypothetical protein